MTKRTYKHSNTFVPQWRLVPTSVAKDYRAGATVLELSRRYKIDTNAISKRLHDLNVRMRPPGVKGSGYRVNQKLFPKQIKEVLELDEQDVSHSDIGRRFNVSRERVRQLCLVADHPTRRSRITSASKGSPKSNDDMTERNGEQPKTDWSAGAKPGKTRRKNERVNKRRSLRDDFAIAALNGYCAHPKVGHCKAKTIAEFAYEMADEMLKRRATSPAAARARGTAV